MKYVLIALVFVLGQQTARADESATRYVQPLFSMANDRDANVDVYALSVFNGAPDSLVLEPNGQGDRSQMFPFAQIGAPDGAVVLTGQGHKVLIVQGTLDPATQEGRFHASYLANGLTNQYTTCDFLLKRNEKGWFVQNAYTGQPVTAVKIITWSLGLKTLQGLCQ